MKGYTKNYKNFKNNKSLKENYEPFNNKDRA